ncbi:MAG TPA: tetratricopeptide repeat protein, partial [Pyrinomonadaceae bacterium]|nr:tetratricopeptide repeat protein [Pyrinomonadaceae bacterium]
MAKNYDDQSLLRRYLLNQLTGDEQEKLEQRLMADDKLFEQVPAAEDELIDQYLADLLSKEEEEMFEKHFLATPERQQKLRFGKALQKYVTTHASPAPKKNLTQSEGASGSHSAWAWPQFLSASPLRAAASVVLILVAGLGVWRVFFYQSDVDKGLVALNAAYQDQRPLEARITQLNYAPFVALRGTEPPNVNEAERQRAELTLLDALNKAPTPFIRHALGKVYLAKNDFDRAKAQFEEALRSDSNNPLIYADLGAAYLEKGKREIERGKSDKSTLETGKGLEDLGRSLENLSKALSLRPGLLEALFNRALCNQYLMLLDQAEGDWREYLKLDSTSRWAEEAQKNLLRLQEQKSQTSATSDKLWQEFRSAYETRNDEAAWLLVRRSRTRAGNLIVETLLDEYLTDATGGRREEAIEKLQRVSYVGKLEEDRVGDSFTSDLAEFYGLATGEELVSLAGARSQMKLANEHFNKGEFEHAIEGYSRARTSFAQKGDIPEALFAESWVGYSRLRIPQTKESAELFEKLSETFAAHKYGSLLAQSLHALADAQSSLNEFSKALDY